MGIMPWDSAIELIKVGVEKIWPDKTKADEAFAALRAAEAQGAFAEIENQWANAKEQLAVNQQEAASQSVFVAGWRPFIGWVCGSAFAWSFVLQPAYVTLLASLGHPVLQQNLPVLDFNQIQPVLYGMLGLGALRTYEKVKGTKALS
jgi:hypothetical protein